jgi:hypothetical protein
MLFCGMPIRTVRLAHSKLRYILYFHMVIICRCKYVVIAFVVVVDDVGVGGISCI